MDTNVNFESLYYISEKFIMESVGTPFNSSPGWATHTMLQPSLLASGFYGRSFFLQQMDIVTEIPNWSKYKAQVTVQCPTPNDTSVIQPLLLGYRDNYIRGSIKIVNPRDR